MIDILIDDLFDKLDHWRNFPAYQLERRADIFFAVYLKELIQYQLKLKVIKVLPEFPLRVGDIYPDLDDNKSYRIDYVVACENGITLFVELKTDPDSIRPEQNEYLSIAKDLKMSKILEGLQKIVDKTSAKDKYGFYLKELEDLKWVQRSSPDKFKVTYGEQQIKLVFIHPNNGLEIDNAISITFLDMINFLKPKKDFLSERLAASLKKWQKKAGE